MVRIGVVGVGFGSAVHIPAYQSEGLEVVAITTRRPERAADAAKKFGVANTFTDFDQMLAMDGLDAVSIVTPPALHHDMAIAAIKAGKHVICEKPFASTTAEAQEMVDAAAASNVTAMVAHEFRFASGRMRIKELLEENYLGTPCYAFMRLVRDPIHGEVFRKIRAKEPVDYVWERDSADAALGWSYMIGSHYIDALLHWFGDVADVQSTLVNTGAERVQDGKAVLADSDDTLFMTLRFKGGLVAQLTGSRAVPFANDFTVELVGDEGVLLTPQEGTNPQAHGVVFAGRVGEDEKPQLLDIPSRLEPFADDRDNRLMPFRLLVREFLRGIEEGTSPSPNFTDALRVQQVLDAARESSRTGSRVAIS